MTWDTSPKDGFVERDASVHKGKFGAGLSVRISTDPRNARKAARDRAASTEKFVPQKRDDPRQGGRRRGSSCISPGGSG